MAGGLTDAGRNYVLSTAFGAVTPDATYYVALILTQPAEDDTGTTINEPTGGGYARVAVTNNTTNFPVPTVGVTSIATDVNFPTATADWGVVRYIGLCDASTAGDLLCWFDLATSVEVENGSTASITGNNLAMTLESR